MESFIPRIGGKRILRKQILERFPTDIMRYIEVFGGAGWLLFSRDKHAPEEIYNDIDGELVNLFRCVKFHCNELQQQMGWLLNSREIFEDAMALKATRGLTDIQRAALYFIVAKQSYGADGHSYGASPKDIGRVTQYLAQISDRLRTVKIERQSYDLIIPILDKVGAFFYCDPPYHGTEGYYDGGFGDPDHERLNSLLRELKGRFLLSYNDDDYIRELYRSFEIEPIERAANLTTRFPDRPNRYKELLIRNF